MSNYDPIKRAAEIARLEGQTPSAGPAPEPPPAAGPSGYDPIQRAAEIARLEGAAGNTPTTPQNAQEGPPAPAGGQTAQPITPEQVRAYNALPQQPRKKGTQFPPQFALPPAGPAPVSGLPQPTQPQPKPLSDWDATNLTISPTLQGPEILSVKAAPLTQARVDGSALKGEQLVQNPFNRDVRRPRTGLELAGDYAFGIFAGKSQGKRDQMHEEVQQMAKAGQIPPPALYKNRAEAEEGKQVYALLDRFRAERVLPIEKRLSDPIVSGNSNFSRYGQTTPALEGALAQAYLEGAKQYRHFEEWARKQGVKLTPAQRDTFRHAVAAELVQKKRQPAINQALKDELMISAIADAVGGPLFGRGLSALGQGARRLLPTVTKWGSNLLAKGAEKAPLLAKGARKLTRTIDPKEILTDSLAGGVGNAIVEYVDNPQASFQQLAESFQQGAVGSAAFVGGKNLSIGAAKAGKAAAGRAEAKVADAMRFQTDIRPGQTLGSRNSNLTGGDVVTVTRVTKSPGGKEVIHFQGPSGVQGKAFAENFYPLEQATLPARPQPAPETPDNFLPEVPEPPAAPRPDVYVPPLRLPEPPPTVKPEDLYTPNLQGDKFQVEVPATPGAAPKFEIDKSAVSQRPKASETTSGRDSLLESIDSNKESLPEGPRKSPDSPVKPDADSVLQRFDSLPDAEKGRLVTELEEAGLQGDDVVSWLDKNMGDPLQTGAKPDTEADPPSVRTVYTPHKEGGRGTARSSVTTYVNAGGYQIEGEATRAHTSVDKAIKQVNEALKRIADRPDSPEARFKDGLEDALKDLKAQRKAVDPKKGDANATKLANSRDGLIYQRPRPADTAPPTKGQPVGAAAQATDIPAAAAAAPKNVTPQTDLGRQAIAEKEQAVKGLKTERRKLQKEMEKLDDIGEFTPEMQDRYEVVENRLSELEGEIADATWDLKEERLAQKGRSSSEVDESQVYEEADADDLSYRKGGDSDADPLDTGDILQRKPGRRRVKVAPITPAKGQKVSRPRQVIEKLSSLIGRSIKQAKAPGVKGALGFYKPSNAQTGIRNANDVDTALHEAGHALDDEWGISDTDAYDKELVKFWVTGTQSSNKSVKRREGVAEWLRAWMLNPDEARALAPGFTKFAEGKLGKQAGELQGLGREIRSHSGAHLGQATGGNVRITRPEKGGALLRFLRGWTEQKGDEFFSLTAGEYFRTHWQDSMIPVAKALSEALGLQGKSVGDLKPTENFLTLARRLSHFQAAISRVIDQGPVTIRGEAVNYVDPITGKIGKMGGVKWLLEPLKGGFKHTEADIERALTLTAEVMVSQRTLDRAQRIFDAAKDEIADLKTQNLPPRILSRRSRAIAVRAAEATAKMSGQGGGVEHDLLKARRNLQQFKDLPAGEQEAILATAHRYRAWANQTLRYYHQKGRITREQYNAIKSTDKFYVDMGRVIEGDLLELVPGRGTGGKRIGSVDEAIQRFGGSLREIDNPFTNLLENTFRMYREADRNDAMRQLTKVLDTNRRFHDGLSAGQAGPARPPVDLSRYGRRVGGPSEDPANPTFRVFNKGVEEHWQFHPVIAASLKEWETIYRPSDMMKLAMIPANLVRTGVTADPGFRVRNVIRDTVERFIKTETEKPWQLFRRYSQAELDSYHFAGGGQSGHYFDDPDSYYRGLQKTIRDEMRSGKSFIALPPGGLLEWWKDLGEKGEEKGRMPEYIRALEQLKREGLSDWDAQLEAARRANDLLDFRTSGLTGGQLNRIIPFFNPAIQGLSGELLTAKRNPVGVAAKWGIGVFAPTMSFYLWNVTRSPEDADDYRQQEPHYRDFFYNVKVGPDSWVRFPKPYGYGVLAGMAERAIDSSLGNKHAWEGFEESAFRAFVPVDETALAGPFKLWIETQAGYDLQRHRHIISPFEVDKPVEEREGAKRASMLGRGVAAGMRGVARLPVVDRLPGAKRLGKADPRQVDHLIEGQLGGTGRLATDISDIARKDKGVNHAVKWGNAVTGLMHTSSAYGARDVQFVLEKARERGETSRQDVKDLQDLLSAYHKSSNPTTRDRLGAQLRKKASSMRAYFEKPKPTSKDGFTKKLK